MRHAGNPSRGGTRKGGTTADFERKLTVAAGGWTVETTRLSRLKVRTNMWWGDQGPEDAYLWMTLPADVDGDDFTRRLRTLSAGDVVELRYESGVEGAVCHFTEAIVTQVALRERRLERPQQTPFRSNRVPQSWQDNEHCGELAITFRMPDQGYMFGPDGPMRMLMPLPVDSEERRSFVLDMIQELADIGAWGDDGPPPETDARS